MVGNPWLLEPDTRQRVALLPARLRFQLMTILTRHLRSGQLTLAPLNPALPVSGETSPWLLQLSGQEGLNDFLELLNTASSFFSTEQLVDLFIFGLSGIEGFPSSWSRWNHLRNTLVSHDIAITLGFILLQSALNSGTIRVALPIRRFDQNRSRVGWFFELRNFGFDWRTLTGAGLTLQARTFETSIGAYHQFNARDGEAGSYLELQLRDQVARSHAHGGWDLSLNSRLRWYLEEPRYSRGQLPPGSAQLYAEAFLRHPFQMQGADASLAFQFSGSTNFENGFNLNSGASLEIVPYALSLTVSGGVARDNLRGWSFTAPGLFLGGTLDSETHRREHQLASLAEGVLATLRSLTFQLRDFPFIAAPYHSRVLCRQLTQTLSHFKRLVTAHAELGNSGVREGHRSLAYLNLPTEFERIVENENYRSIFQTCRDVKPALYEILNQLQQLPN